MSLLTGKHLTEVDQPKNNDEQPTPYDYWEPDEYLEILQHLEEETLDSIPLLLNTQQQSTRQRKNKCPLRRRPVPKIETGVPEVYTVNLHRLRFYYLQD